MSNDADDPPSHHRSWFRSKVPPWPVTVIGGALVWARTVAIYFDKIENNVPRMRDAALRAIGRGEPRHAAAAPLPAPEPPRVIEVVKPLLPCVSDVTEMLTMIRAVGAEKYERPFDAHFKGRETCFVLTLVETGTVQMAFTVQAGWNANPTFIVQPKAVADVKKYKAGARLKITGELTRYIDVTGISDPDQIHIMRARLAEAPDSDGGTVTGSIRR
jgi:hypothetical protein